MILCVCWCDIGPSPGEVAPQVGWGCIAMFAAAHYQTPCILLLTTEHPKMPDKCKFWFAGKKSYFPELRCRLNII